MHVAVLRHPLRLDDPDHVCVDCYLETTVLPSLRHARLVANAVKAAVGQRHVTVAIRTDSWFVEDSFFRLWYLFEPTALFPSHAEYVARGEIYCNGDVAGIDCAPMRFPGLLA